MKMNKKYVVTGLTCALTAGLLMGNVDYASHTFAAAKLAAKGTEAVVEKAVKNTKEKRNAAGVTKEESVYVMMDANGKEEEIIVSDWLRGSGVEGTVPDKTTLVEIQNTKGEETFTQNGKKLYWEAGEKDIYYQGKSEKQLPVTMDITYFLDGKEITPKELAGKSGKVTIKIHYQNHAGKQVKIAGKKQTIYTPFLMATGMILPVENFSNIAVDHGEILSEGDKAVVVAYGMPGLKESLSVKQETSDKEKAVDLQRITDKITDSVTITADVTEFSLGKTYTVATDKPFEEIEFEEADQADSLSDKLDELEKATKELVDGSNQIQENLNKLDYNFDTYGKAIGKLKGSVRELNTGSQEINKAAKSYTKSADKLLGAVNNYADGTKSFAENTKTYSQSTKKIIDGVEKLKTASAAFPESYKGFHTQLVSYTDAVNALLSAENLQKMTSGTQSLKDGITVMNQNITSAGVEVKKWGNEAKELNQQDTDTLLQNLEVLADSADDRTSQVAKEAIRYIQSARDLSESVEAHTNGTTDGAADEEGTKDLALVLAQMQSATSADSEKENLYSGIETLDENMKLFAGNAETIRGSKAAFVEASTAVQGNIGTIVSNLDVLYQNGSMLVAKNTELEAAADEIVTNAGKIKKNSKKLTASSGDFRAATRQMAKGTKELWSGVKILFTSTNQLSDGIGKLTEGAKALYDGMRTFQEEGTEKVAEAVECIFGDGDNLQERAEAVQKAAESYKTYSGTVAEMDGEVKFIMTTDSIEANE